jgi:hypothetical protein
MRRISVAFVAAGVWTTALWAAGVADAGRPAAATPLPGTGTSCPLFPADNVWHADVSGLPVHARSADWINSMGGPERRLHPDFGPNGDDQPYGIPYTVVSGSAQKVSVAFDYDDESDAGPYPFGPSTPIEGGSDAHALMVDKDNCVLYELFAAAWNGGRPTAGSGAIWDLRSHGLRPSGWTSADAAGLPILPGLLRRDEVAAGEVDHAIRLTAARTDRTFLWPARHHAGAARDPSLPPMGAWFRLKAGFDISRFRPDTQVVLRAMQRHGLILADNGSNWYFTGTSEPGWDTALLSQLKTIPAGAFEAVEVSSLMADPNSGRAASSSAPPPSAPAPATTPTTARPTATTGPKATTTTTITRPAPTTTTTPSAEAATTTSVTAAVQAEPPMTTAPQTDDRPLDGPLAGGPGPPGGPGRGGLAAVALAVAVAGGAVSAYARRRRTASSP